MAALCEKNTHMKISSVLTSCILLVSVAWAQDFKAEFAVEYSRIVELISSESWRELRPYESKNIKCGFGPNEEGAGCVENLLLDNPQCKEKILFALNQGCNIIQRGEQTKCLAPAQGQDPDIILPLSARVELNYEASTSKVTIRSMICGGD